MLDANIPIYAMRTVDEQIDLSLRTERLVAGLSAIFGGLATLLAVIGLYGVMAYTVTRRTREIGIRLALGADGSHVLWMVMKEVLFLLGVGIVIAVPLSLMLTRLVASQCPANIPTPGAPKPASTSAPKPPSPGKPNRSSPPKAATTTTTSTSPSTTTPAYCYAKPSS